ncbi:unnamed protein product (mitochondrion) [Plasmodiophora brassicae]|uniref:Polynucleotide kinase 3'-phosphatase n=2 Tax=Plasmodiophora brassicae TaxID=37360 RepID=A0A3P3YI27_PLABS|nr:unnamed protein product [Plasmodiophora brassicae]
MSAQAKRPIGDDAESDEEWRATRKRPALVQATLFPGSVRISHDMVAGGDVLRLVSPAFPEFLSTRRGASVPVIAVDFDGTLVTTKPITNARSGVARPGPRFPKSASDWAWTFPIVSKKLKSECEARGAVVAILSNQSGASKSKPAFDLVRDRFRLVMQSLPKTLPVCTLASIRKDSVYRKPETGLWTLLVDWLRKDFDIQVDASKSIYVGDAAGRPAVSAKRHGKADFACSDRAFAHNAKIDFMTPEEFFLGEPAEPFIMHDPVTYLGNRASLQPVLDKLVGPASPSLEILLLQAWPGSGKTTFATAHLSASHTIVNQDTLASLAKCLKAAEAALSDGKSVCIDNTNANRAVRAQWVALAKKYPGSTVRVARFDVDRNLAEHLNCMRGVRFRLGLPLSKPALKSVCYHTYAKYYQEPSLDEGFSEIITIPFVPTFEDDHHRQQFLAIYRQE